MENVTLQNHPMDSKDLSEGGTGQFLGRPDVRGGWTSRVPAAATERGVQEWSHSLAAAAVPAARAGKGRWSAPSSGSSGHPSGTKALCPAAGEALVVCGGRVMDLPTRLENPRLRRNE